MSLSYSYLNALQTLMSTFWGSFYSCLSYFSLRIQCITKSKWALVKVNFHIVCWMKTISQVTVFFKVTLIPSIFWWLTPLPKESFLPWWKLPAFGYPWLQGCPSPCIIHVLPNTCQNNPDNKSSWFFCLNPSVVHTGLKAFSLTSSKILLRAK